MTDFITDEMVEAAWRGLADRCAATPTNSPDFGKVARLVFVSKDDLRAALVAAMRAAWRPIESEDSLPNDDTMTEMPFDFREGVAVAFCEDGSPSHLVFYEYEPGFSETTHWMPLPPPPAKEGV